MSNDIAAAKKRMRREIRQRRQALPPDPGRGERVATAFLTHPQISPHLAQGTAVTAYVSAPGEPPTCALRLALTERNIRVYLPAAHQSRTMTWHIDPGGDLAQAWGLPGQPTLDASRGITSSALVALRPEIIIVPALAATADGRRLGQGGGYFDTLLAGIAPHAHGGPLLVALVGADEVLTDIPVEPHDALVDVVVAA